MRYPILLSLLLFAWTASAAPIDDARARYGTAVAQHAQAAAARVSLAASQDALASQIERLKSTDRPLLPGVRDGRLDALLKMARAQADRLAALDRKLAVAAAAVDEARRGLGSALAEELVRTQRALASARAAERGALFTSLKALADEQSRLARARAVGPSAPSAPVALPATRSEDPDELRELADEAGDHAEQMRSQLALVEQRLDELRTRRRLLRAEVAFRRDELLFAESERNRVVVRTDRAREPGTVGVGRDDGQPTNAPEVAAGGRGDVVTGDGPGASEPPAAASGDDGMENAGGGFNDGAAPPAPDGDQDGAAEGGGDTDRFEGDPSPGLDADPVAAPEPAAAVATVLPGADGGATHGGGALVIGDVLDPSLLTDSVDALSPQDLGNRIAAIEAQRKALESSVGRLDARRRALRDRAQALESD